MTVEGKARNRFVWFSIIVLWIFRGIFLIPWWIYLMFRDGFLETCYLQTSVAQLTGLVSVVTLCALVLLSRRAKVDGEQVLTAEAENEEVGRGRGLRRLIVIPFFVGGILFELKKPAGERFIVLIVVWAVLLVREIASLTLERGKRSRAGHGLRNGADADSAATE